MRQTPFSSFVESLTSTALGFLISMGVLEAVNQIWGLALDLVDNVTITCIFTVASLLRAYAVRRFFNYWLHRPKASWTATRTSHKNL